MVACTTPVWACRRTPRKPSGGSAWPPSRDTPGRSTPSDHAQYNLGVKYDTGEGVPQDAAEAVRWFRLAAEQGIASVQNNLGLMYPIFTGWAWMDNYPFLYSARNSSWMYLLPSDEGLWVLDMASNEWTLIE